MGDIRFCCRVCGQKLAIDGAAAGWEIRCPQCGASQTVEAAGAALAAAPQSSPPAPEVKPAIPEFASREPGGGEEFQYEAFISYRHAEPDRTLAKWLHTALETYRVPKNLVQERSLPPRLKKLFRDEEELPASADLNREIERALTKSRFLIVICSPQTPPSQWVNAEVALFRKLGRHDQILALLIEGEPAESFPQALREIRRTITGPEGTINQTIEEVEPLAADVRASRKESQQRLRKLAKLRILASLLGVPFDALRQRERARQIRRSLVVAASILGLLSGALAYLLQHQKMTTLEGYLDINDTAQRLELEKKAIAVKAEQKAMAFQAEQKALALKMEAKALDNSPPPFEEIQLEWKSTSKGTRQQIAEQRQAITNDLPTYKVAQVIDAIRESENMTSYRSRSARQSSTNIQIQGRLPEKFLLQGWLVAVRHVTVSRRYYPQSSFEGTLVFVGTETSGVWDFEKWIESGDETEDTPPYGGIPNQQPNQQRSSSRSALMPDLLCVVFEGKTFAENMADYRVGQMVSVAIQRQPRGVSDPFASMLKPFQMADEKGEINTSNPYWKEFSRFGMPHHFKVLWTCEGKGIEMLGKPSTWIDPTLGRREEIIGKDILRRSLYAIHRDPLNYIGANGLLEAEFTDFLPRSSFEDPTTVAYTPAARRKTLSETGFLLATVYDTVDGPIHAIIMPGKERKLEEFSGYKRGDIIQLDATVMGVINLERYKTRLQSNSTDRSPPGYPNANIPRPQAVQSSSRTTRWIGALNKNIDTDQLSELLPLFPVANSLMINSRWVYIKGKPGSMVFANGPK